MKLKENLKWRYATKKFDATKKVSEDHINYIKEAIQLSAASYGLQNYRVLIIKNPVLRETLKPISWGQTQITDASHLFVFCNYTQVLDHDIDALMKLKAEVSEIDISALSGYGDFIKVKLKEKSDQEIMSWTAKQTYIALANALSACPELKIDSTPIEGFEVEAYNETLGLAKKGLNASVILAIGYRHDEDQTQHSKKVRQSIEDLFEEV